MGGSSSGGGSGGGGTTGGGSGCPAGSANLAAAFAALSELGGNGAPAQSAAARSARVASDPEHSSRGLKRNAATVAGFRIKDQLSVVLAPTWEDRRANKKPSCAVPKP